MDKPPAISTRLLKDRPLVDVIGSFARAGFKQLEVSTHPGHFEPGDRDLARRIGQEALRHGLEIISLHAPYSAPVDITIVQRGERQLAMREVGEAAQALADMGGRFLVVHAGSTIQPGPYLDERLSALRESLEALRALCRSLSVQLLLEEMEPGTFGGRDEDLRYLMSLDATQFDGFCLDVAHSQLSGSLFERIALLAPRLRLVHLSDAGPTHGDHEHLLPGDGAVPWPRLMDELRSRLPDVPLVLEVDGWGAPDDEALQQARTRLARATSAAR